jgi:glycosyltransferase involved in cell wall biosynthesis
LPVVGVQALAMGLAMVGSTSGFVDLIKPGENGYLFPANDTDHFASALAALVTDPVMLLKFRKNSRRLAADFDLQAILDRYEILLVGKARNS